MSKTLTNSLALLHQIKSQFDANKDFRESKVTDSKNYGSIKRLQNANPIIPVTQYMPSQVPKNQKYTDESELR